MNNTTSFGYLIPTARKVSPLRQRMIEDMTVRNFAPNTQQSYLGQVGLFARHFGKSPEQLGPEEIRTYQIYLAQERKVSVGTRVVAVSALRCFTFVTSSKPTGLANCTFTASFSTCPIRPASLVTWLRYENPNGWSTPSHRLVARKEY
jgi:hypothetical protein